MATRKQKKMMGAKSLVRQCITVKCMHSSKIEVATFKDFEFIFKYTDLAVEQRISEFLDGFSLTGRPPSIARIIARDVFNRAIREKWFDKKHLLV